MYGALNMMFRHKGNVTCTVYHKQKTLKLKRHFLCPGAIESVFSPKIIVLAVPTCPAQSFYGVLFWISRILRTFLVAVGHKQSLLCAPVESLEA